MSSMAELLDVFFNGRKANTNGAPGLGGIDRKCPKCGVVMAALEYNRTFNRIDLRCIGGCGYTWSAQPLDSHSAKAGTT